MPSLKVVGLLVAIPALIFLCGWADKRFEANKKVLYKYSAVASFLALVALLIYAAGSV
jgi:hypothetical protein